MGFYTFLCVVVSRKGFGGHAQRTRNACGGAIMDGRCLPLLPSLPKVCQKCKGQNNFKQGFIQHHLLVYVLGTVTPSLSPL